MEKVSVKEEQIMEKKVKKQKIVLYEALAVMLAAVVLLLVCYGCGSGRDKNVFLQTQPRKFGATYMTMNNPYFQDMNAQIEEIVEANGDILGAESGKAE